MFDCNRCRVIRCFIFFFFFFFYKARKGEGPKAENWLHVNFASTVGYFGPWLPRRDVSCGGGTSMAGSLACKGGRSSAWLGYLVVC